MARSAEHPVYEVESIGFSRRMVLVGYSKRVIYHQPSIRMIFLFVIPS